MNSFQWKHILLCAPREKSLALQELLKQYQIEAFVFPTLETKALPPPSIFEKMQHSFQADDHLIFVSPSAVHHSFEQMTPAMRRMVQDQHCFAIGPSTVYALKAMNVRQVSAPSDFFNSEAFLALTVLQKVKGKRFFIFKGVSGRDLIASTLQERGAQVVEVVTYQTFCPKHDIAPLLALWKTHPFELVVTTSQSGLENLWTLLEGQHSLLFNTVVTVMNQRTDAWAKRQGIRTLLISDASLEGLMRVLRT